MEESQRQWSANVVDMAPGLQRVENECRIQKGKSNETQVYLTNILCCIGI